MERIVGVVGKPNVGKSTFFSAATLVSVQIANYPFTTIKPNRGVAYVRTKCVHPDFGVEDTPRNSMCVGGTRLIPVELIDCAGLVPDAWQGKGLGNQFLDEIRRADALIHVVDAAGATDEEGRPIPPGTHDPLDDVKFLERELDMWVVQILKKDWDKTVRRVEATKEKVTEVLAERLSGLQFRLDQLVKSLQKSGLDLGKPSSWTDEDLRRLVGDVRASAKPMLLAANKIDLAQSEANLPRLKGTSYPVVPCSAEAELALRRAAEKGITEYVPGAREFRVLKPEALTAEQRNALDQVRDRILLKWGGTGVQAAIDGAYIELLRMVTVYPVEDPEHLTDHEGRVLPDAYLVPQGTKAREFAGMIHGDLAAGFLYGIEVRTGKRIGEDYVLRDRDVISIVSAKKRG
jgi:ribosome-binding ATPase YchF (GTP1/OBG family)